MVSTSRSTSVAGGILLSALILTPAFAGPEDADHQLETENTGKAVAIEQTLPDFPGKRPRLLHEGWVRMSYVVTADGRAVDPVVINASGGAGFEEEVRKVTEQWRFEPPDTGAEMPYNIYEIRFTVLGHGKGITRKYSRYARHIMANLQKDKVDSARGVANEALRVGGWNLYESTILWLMLGRVEGAEGDAVEKLEMYRRGLATSDKYSVKSDARADLLEDIFQLEDEFGQYAAAAATFEALKEVRGSKDAVERLAPRAEEIMAALRNDPVVTARATIYNPCDCDEGIPIWDYVPYRRSFSFANIDGDVERFEARCEGKRISDTVKPGQTWTLDNDWGFCRIFVFGDDAATFDFLEHLQDNAGDDGENQTTVAANHVLDTASRDQ